MLQDGSLLALLKQQMSAILRILGINSYFVACSKKVKLLKINKILSNTLVQYGALDPMIYMFGIYSPFHDMCESLQACHDCIVYLYSEQYLNVLQDSKQHLVHPTVQVQSNSQITDITLTETQRLKGDHLSMSLRFFNLPLGIGPNDRGAPF